MMVKSLDEFLKTWRWPALALLASLCMLGAAHAFERFALLAPCPLCLRQREVYWAVVAMATTALVLWRFRQNPRFMFAINIMLGLVFLTGAVVAGYHAGVEYDWWPAPSGCGAALAVDVMALDLGAIDEPQAVASCETDPFGGRLGLSMAGWNMVASAILSVISFKAAGVTFGARPMPALAE